MLEKGERRQLPHCVVAKLRQCYPEKCGNYVGYYRRIEVVMMACFQCVWAVGSVHL